MTCCAQPLEFFARQEILAHHEAVAVEGGAVLRRDHVREPRTAAPRHVVRKLGAPRMQPAAVQPRRADDRIVAERFRAGRELRDPEGGQEITCGIHSRFQCAWIIRSVLAADLHCDRQACPSSAKYRPPGPGWPCTDCGRLRSRPPSVDKAGCRRRTTTPRRPGRISSQERQQQRALRARPRRVLCLANSLSAISIEASARSIAKCSEDRRCAARDHRSRASGRHALRATASASPSRSSSSPRPASSSSIPIWSSARSARALRCRSSISEPDRAPARVPAISRPSPWPIPSCQSSAHLAFA